jgi:hypothetical protein
MKKRSSARTYVLYENYEGRYTPHWQYMGKPKIPGCFRNVHGHAVPPPFPLVVRGNHVTQACALANESVTSLGHPNHLGIWWRRGVDQDPPPLGKNLTLYPTTVAYCQGSPTAMAHDGVSDAEEALEWINRYGCGNGCSLHHEIVTMTVDEGKKRGFTWYTPPPSECDE